MPLFHSGGGVVSEIGTFSRKGTFVLMQSFDPGLFLELIEAERCNNSLIVPTMILALLNHPDLKKRDVSSFKSILSGAATVPAPLVRRATKEFDCQFCIMYGQTEANGPFTETLTTDSPELQSETIGRPIPHCEVKVVNTETLKTVPVGTIGEFWVRGFMTMSGYYGQPEATKAALTEDGWLRTGDLGTMDENGYFRITGRLKEMIIRGGMNLYPKEIEDILFEHPGFTQVAVAGLPDETWGEVVGAVVMAKDLKKPSVGGRTAPVLPGESVAPENARKVVLRRAVPDDRHRKNPEERAARDGARGQDHASGLGAAEPAVSRRVGRLRGTMGD